MTKESQAALVDNYSASTQCDFIFQDNCVPSRISVLLLSFHYKAWIFGAAYYWLTWVLLGSVLCGSLYSIYFMRFILTKVVFESNPSFCRTPTRGVGDEADLLDSDDEETLHGPLRDDIPSPNPFD